jgi:hypothetical protein
MINTKEIKAASLFSRLAIGVQTPFTLETQWRSDSLLHILLIVGKRDLLLLRRSGRKVRKRMSSWEASRTMNRSKTSLLENFKESTSRQSIITFTLKNRYQI